MNYINRSIDDISTVASISIHPSGAPVYPVGSTVQLYEQASVIFSQLDVDNVFNGERNTFRDIEARRICLTSDVRRKQDIRPLSRADATELVRRLSVFTYSIDSRRAAGVMANTVPEHYSENNTVDYISLLMHLWVSVQDVHQKIDKLQKRKKHRSKKSPDGIRRNPIHATTSGPHFGVHTTPGCETAFCLGRAAFPNAGENNGRNSSNDNTWMYAVGILLALVLIPRPLVKHTRGLLTGYLLHRIVVSSMTDPREREDEFFNQYSIEGMNDNTPPKKKDDEQERKKKSSPAKSLLPIGVIGR